MWPVLLSLALPSDEVLSEIAADEVVAFYPTYAHRTTDGESWVLHIHGAIFEPEESSRKRAAFVGMLRRWLDLSDEEAETAVFRTRIRTFLVDNERNKTIYIRLGNSLYRAGKSLPNGHFSSDLVLSAELVETLLGSEKVGDRTLTFKALLPAADHREFTGQVRLIEPRGVSVISDIDDTIKFSQVTDRRALLANTFLRPFKAIDAMSDVYRQWHKQGAEFHYVSASPWQLYVPIAEFLAEEEFPKGSLHMKTFRLKDSSALALVTSPEKYKPEVIAKILTDFPQRKFVLVGDSGERDPEIFGDLARQHPQQVVGIYIREAQAPASPSSRYEAAFRDIDNSLWRVFSEPASLSDALASVVDKARRPSD